MTKYKPFNDVIDHYDKIEGNAANGNLRKQPKPIRYFGYFFISFFAIGILLLIILNVLR